MSTLNIKNLTVRIDSREVVKSFSLTINSGEIHVLAGPNGSGKSSLAYALAGHPDYEIVGGEVLLENIKLLELAAEERAAAGLFLSFQEPPEIGGISMETFLRSIAPNKESNEFAKVLPSIGLETEFLSRSLNEGFSGGEKKKSEILQLLSRRPKIAILDEIDTGLDIDSLRSVYGLLNRLKNEKMGILLISHSTKLFDNLNVDQVNILIDGKIITSGGRELVSILEEKGYEAIHGVLAA